LIRLYHIRGRPTDHTQLLITPPDEFGSRARRTLAVPAPLAVDIGVLLLLHYPVRSCLIRHYFALTCSCIYFHCLDVPLLFSHDSRLPLALKGVVCTSINIVFSVPFHCSSCVSVLSARACVVLLVQVSRRHQIESVWFLSTFSHATSACSFRAWHTVSNGSLRHQSPISDWHLQLHIFIKISCLGIK
jgi:hypothetical protein